MRPRASDIPCDYNGRPLPTRGIDIGSNTKYVAVTGGGIGILHYLIPAMLHFILLPAWAIMGFICLIPGLLASAGGPNPASITLGAVGVVVWIWLTFRYSRKISRAFSRHTRYNYVNGYRGPVASLTRR